MSNRAYQLFQWLWSAGLFGSGGVVAVYIMLRMSRMSLGEFIHELGPVAGFAIGLALVGGGVVMAIVYWFFTGHSLVDQLMFGCSMVPPYPSMNRDFNRMCLGAP